MSGPSRGVSVVVLAKHTHEAKTGLRLSASSARGTALMLAAPTIRTASAADSVGAVLVVTGDRRIAMDALEVNACVVWEGSRPLGMNRAAALGRSEALKARPDAPVAILVADLPYLCPTDLDAAVEAFGQHGAPTFVADHRGLRMDLDTPEDLVRLRRVAAPFAVTSRPDKSLVAAG